MKFNVGIKDNIGIDTIKFIGTINTGKNYQIQYVDLNNIAKERIVIEKNIDIFSLALRVSGANCPLEIKKLQEEGIITNAYIVSTDFSNIINNELRIEGFNISKAINFIIKHQYEENVHVVYVEEKNKSLFSKPQKIYDMSKFSIPTKFGTKIFLTKKDIKNVLEQVKEFNKYGFALKGFMNTINEMLVDVESIKSELESLAYGIERRKTTTQTYTLENNLVKENQKMYNLDEKEEEDEEEL